MSSPRARIAEAIRPDSSIRPPVEVRTTKSQVAFRGRRAFAWLWRPGQYLAHPDAEIVLSLALARRDLAMVEVLYSSGLRVAELCGLDTTDLDAARGLVRVLGKGGKERSTPVGGPARRAQRAGSTAVSPLWS